MNSIFIYSFWVLLFVTGWMDLQKVKKLGKAMRRLHFLFYFATLALFLCIVLEIDLPMPTEFFIDNVSPWVLRMIHPT